MKGLLAKLKEMDSDRSPPVVPTDPLQNLVSRLSAQNKPPGPSKGARLLFQTDRDGITNACTLLAKYPVTAKVCFDFTYICCS